MKNQRQSKATSKKTTQNIEKPQEDRSRESSPASCSSSANANHGEGEEEEMEISLKTIFSEIKGFRQDNKQQLTEIKDEIGKTKIRLDEAEERIAKAEERLQSMEEVMAELIKLQAHLEAKQTDQEGRARRNNIRIYSVIEGSENNSPSMITFVEELLKQNLSLPADRDLQIERAHRALGPSPPEGAPPRSIIVKFLSYRTKEEILRKTWQKKGFVWKDKQINLDHDYAPNILRKRQEYAEAKKILKEKGIRFQTPFPARLRVFFPDGTRTYNTAEEATKELAEKGMPITVIRPPESLLEKIQSLTWTASGRRGRAKERKQQGGTTVKDRLQKFSWEPAQKE